MSDPSIRTTIEELLAVEPAACDRDGLARVVRLTERARSWLAAVEVQVARRGRELAASGTSESPEEMLSDHGRRSTKDARAADARSEVCEALPGFADALADGSVSTGHVDAIANATRHLDEEAREQLSEREAELLRLAAT